jgi:hypothetical protein
MENGGNVIRFLAGSGDFSFCISFTSVMEPTEPLFEWFPMELPPEIWRQEREADHPFPHNAKVKNVWSYTSTPIHLQVVHRANFAFHL